MSPKPVCTQNCTRGHHREKLELFTVEYRASYSFCLGLVHPLTTAWLVSAVSSANHGAALGFKMLVNRFMQTLMPLLVGGLSIPFGLLGSALLELSFIGNIAAR